jgi:hypothetical protein
MNWLNQMLFSVRALGVGSVAAVAAFLSSGCDQPKIQCTAGHGEFALKYKPVSGTCPTPPGNVAGVQAYVKGVPGARPTFGKPPVAIKPAELGELAATYGQPVDILKVSAVGEFSDEEPGPDGFCRVGPLTPAAVTFAPVPAMTDAMGMMKPALPAVDVKYEWSDVKYYVTAANPGTQFTGRLKYTLNGCVAEYDVVALAPAVPCEKLGPDDKGTGMPDETLCSPCADVAAGRATGSGIGPNIETVCDPELLLCVPKNAPPSLRSSVIQCKATMAPPAAVDAATTPGAEAGARPDGGSAADGAPPDGGPAADAAGDGASGG